ncbi:MAG: N-acetylmuramoyl-L-alanine amidase [Burkholderiales bacterium]
MLIVAAHRLQGATVTHASTVNHDGIIKPKFLVFHFTAITFAATVARFKDPTQGNRVSAHLLVGRDGRIVQFLDFNLRAWHAGQSTWNGITDINSHSIGIELENAGSVRMEDGRGIGEEGVIVPAEQVIEASHKHAKWTMTHWHQYSSAQLDACHDIAIILANTYAIEDIVGHDDIAPDRKQDPGPAFPLESVRSKALGRAGIGL